MTGDDRWLPASGSAPEDYKYQKFGNQIRVEVDGPEVRLVFVANDHRKANALADDLLAQLKRGSIKINVAGKITGVTEV